MVPSDTIELIIPAKADYIGVVRLTISGIANRMGFSYDDIEDIKVAVSEAITNAVQHAYGQEEKEEGKVKIQVQTFVDRIDIYVMDNGQSFEMNDISRKLNGLDSAVSFDQLTEGGLGLYLIETLMDRVSISGDSGVIVYMSKSIDKGEVERYAGQIFSSYD